MSMKSMYELRDMLCDELDEIARKGELGAGDLDIAHKLASTIKNLDKIEAIEDGGYSRAGYQPRRYRTMSTEVVAPTQEAESIMSGVITAATAHATE